MPSEFTGSITLDLYAERDDADADEIHDALRSYLEKQLETFEYMPNGDDGVPPITVQIENVRNIEIQAL